nr:MAG: hypothetical protein [Hubei chryso-like virus 1]
MDTRKYFMENRYTRMGDIIGEGKRALDTPRFEGMTLGDVSPSMLVETKPIKHHVIGKADKDKLLDLQRKTLLSIGANKDGLAPKAGEVYQAIREAGAAYSNARSLVSIGQITNEPGKNMVCRKKDYYESIHHLGAHFFSAKPAKLRGADPFVFRIEYCIFGDLSDGVCDGVGSGQYSVEAKLEILAPTGGGNPRYATKWVDWNDNPTRYFNAKCQDVISDSSLKVEDLMTALALPRENITIRNDEMAELKAYLKLNPTACLASRFMVLYLVMMRLWHANRRSFKLDSSTLKIQGVPFSAQGLNTCLRAPSGSTVINVVNMTEKEQVIMARSAMGYANGDIPIDGFDLNMGGFDVQPEVDKNGIIFLLGAEPTVKYAEEITLDDIYETMVKYAMKMQACGEMEMGFNLAGNLLFADGLPSFSVPRPQGYVDIVASALSNVNNSGFVPPYAIDELNMLGFFVLSRQQLLMIHDVLMYAEGPKGRDAIPLLRMPSESRQLIYHKYKETRFSDAFGLTSLIDPLLVQTAEQVERVRAVAFPTIAWSSINHDHLVKNTLSEFFWRGQWVDLVDWRNLDDQSQRNVLSTYYANGLLNEPKTLGVRVKEVIGVSLHSRQMRVPTGPVCTTLVSVECVPRCKRESQQKFAKVPFSKPKVVDEDESIDTCFTETPILVENDGESGEKEENSGGNGAGAKEKETAGEQIINTARANIESVVAKVSDIKLRVIAKQTEDPLMESIITGIGKYLNKKLCSEDSLVPRIRHLMYSWIEDGVGVRCPLRGLLGMGGMRSKDAKHWPLVVELMYPYLMQLDEKRVVSMHDGFKLLTHIKAIRKYGCAKSHFDMNALPVYRQDGELYRCWIIWLGYMGITVSYKGNKMPVKGSFSDKEKDPLLDMLMDMTLWLRFPMAENLMHTWGWEPQQVSVERTVDKAFLAKMKSGLDKKCHVCVC